MNSYVKALDPPLAAEGGVNVPITGTTDPFEALDNLMSVIEMLCPEWPARESSANFRNLRL